MKLQFFCCKSQQGFIMKDLKGLRTTVGIPYVIKITQTVHTVHGISEKGTKFEIDSLGSYL